MTSRDLLPIRFAVDQVAKTHLVITRAPHTHLQPAWTPPEVRLLEPQGMLAIKQSVETQGEHINLRWNVYDDDRLSVVYSSINAACLRVEYPALREAYRQEQSRWKTMDLERWIAERLAAAPTHTPTPPTGPVLRFSAYRNGWRWEDFPLCGLSVAAATEKLEGLFGMDVKTKPIATETHTKGDSK